MQRAGDQRRSHQDKQRVNHVDMEIQDAETGYATKLSLRRGAAGTNAAPPPHHPRPLALESPHTRHTIIDTTPKRHRG